MNNIPLYLMIVVLVIALIISVVDSFRWRTRQREDRARYERAANIFDKVAASQDEYINALEHKPLEVARAIARSAIVKAQKRAARVRKAFRRK